MANLVKIGVCIVGCGSYARKVLDDIRNMTSDAEFYFASRDPGKARKYCEDYGGKGYFGNYETAALDPRIQAMYFLTPHDLHLSNIKLACLNKKHVLLEKPIARNLNEARKIITIAEDNKITLMIAENFRFLRIVAKCKELIAQGIIGELRMIEVRHEGYEIDAVDWRANLERNGGGRFIDGGVHWVDIMLNLGGVPKSVYAVTQSPKVLPDHEGEDGIVVTAKLPNDVTGLIYHSGGTAISEVRDRVQITGTKGLIDFNPNQSLIAIETVRGKDTIDMGSGDRGVRQMFNEFLDCIIRGRKPQMSGYEALKDLAVVLAAYQSVRLNSVVAINEGFL